MRTISYAYAGAAATVVSIADDATSAQQTTAIQAALDAVAGRLGAVVALSAGTFSIEQGSRPQDGALRIGSLTEFHGAGMGATVLRLADGSGSVTGILRTDSGRTRPDGTAITTSDVLIHDLTIDGNKAGTSGATDGFYCGPRPGSTQADTNITLDHVEICNVSRYGFDPHEQTIGLTISNSVAHGNGVDGFTLDFCSQVTLASNAAYDNGRHGFNIVTSSSHLTLIDNDAYRNGATGITVQTGDNEVRAWSHDVTISGGNVYGNTLDGISIRQTERVSVTAVSLEGNGGNGVSLWGVIGADLHGNTVLGVPLGFEAQKATGYLQTFGDSDPLNDRYIATTEAYFDGVLQSPPDTSAGATPWTWVVTVGDDDITGSDGIDAIAADAGDDLVNGGRGDDVIYGNDGNDIIAGDEGKDTLYGGYGDDRLVTDDRFDGLHGGLGYDTADYGKFMSALFANLGAPQQWAWTSGTAFTNSAVTTQALGPLTQIEAIVGTAFADTLVGDARDNRLDGGKGDDKLVGGAGNDTMIGGAGNDRISGGIGDDIATGGAGRDLFRFETAWGHDTVTEFTRGLDKLDMQGVADLHGLADLAISQTGGDATIAYASETIALQGIDASTLSAADFLFHA